MTEREYWLYGLSIGDLDFTLHLVRGLAEAKFSELQRWTAELRAGAPGHADDALDDLGPYTWMEVQYLWQFGLWRLQGVFEGLIVYRLLGREGAGLPGLRTKLEAVKAAGYELSDAESTELVAWGRLRNAVSHAPPEQFRPGPLREEDVLEYHALVSALCHRWGLGEA